MMVIGKLEKETPAARSTVLKPADLHRELFGYQAGQILSTRVPIDGAGCEKPGPVCDMIRGVAI